MSVLVVVNITLKESKTLLTVYLEEKMPPKKREKKCMEVLLKGASPKVDTTCFVRVFSMFSEAFCVAVVR